MGFSPLLQQLMMFESDINYVQPAPNGTDPTHVETGRIPLLISAPHATAHRRATKAKKEDEFTGAMARLLAKRTGAHLILSKWQRQDDPNWDLETPYKQRLATHCHAHNIRFVLDLHGMSNRHRFGLAVGSINNRTCPALQPIIEHQLSQHGFSKRTTEQVADNFLLSWDQMVINHPRFTGGRRNQTITRFVHETLQLPAVQIELCSSIRVVERRRKHRHYPRWRGSPAGIRMTVHALDAVIRHVAAELER